MQVLLNLKGLPKFLCLYKSRFIPQDAYLAYLHPPSQLVTYSFCLGYNGASAPSFLLHTPGIDHTTSCIFFSLLLIFPQHFSVLRLTVTFLAGQQHQGACLPSSEILRLHRGQHRCVVLLLLIYVTPQSSTQAIVIIQGTLQLTIVCGETEDSGAYC